MEQTAYYKKFNNRTPYSAQNYSQWRVFIFQFLAIIFICIGVSYLHWRWTVSLNLAALWFSVPLVVAETLMFVGSILMILNYGRIKTLPRSSPVRLLSEIASDIDPENDRPVKINLFITTYNEELAIVEDTVRDALKLNYPFQDVTISIFLCDDGRRDGRDPDKENFRLLAEKYNINYLVRENNKGFKAGNLNNAFWKTDGDFIVILDADTRVFPGFLKNLTGYFRNEKMAWVQSPQWFYDIPEGLKPKEWIAKLFPSFGKFISGFKFGNSKATVGKNILGTDSRIFYDYILRNRNASNAAFCCGAGSVHRRSSLEHLIQSQTKRLIQLGSTLPVDPEGVKNKQLLPTVPDGKSIVGPFVHHISEDIYTSVLMHADKAGYESYQHPDVECKMLSPQTLSGYIRQFSRYAEGTFQLCFSRENPLIIKGLDLRQRLAYFETVYSYFSPFWILIFLLSPVVFYFTLIPPITAFNFDFFLRFLAFNILNILIATVGHWGMSTKRSEQYYISGFWYKLKALIKVITGSKILFNTTSKSLKKENPLHNLRFIAPHLIIILLTLGGFIYNVDLIANNLHPSYSAFIANSIWAFYNIYQLNPIIRAAFRTP